MKTLISLALLSIFVFSNCNHKGENNSMAVNGTDHIEDTIVYKSEVKVDSMLSDSEDEPEMWVCSYGRLCHP